MAKKAVRVKGTDRAIKAANKVFKKTKRNKRLLKEMGEETLQRILFQTRKGNRMEGNKLRKLKNLRDITVDIRRGVSKVTPEQVDPTFFKPKKANNTFTGQLLDSLDWVIKKTSVFIVIKGRRRNVDYDRVLKGLKRKKAGGLRKSEFNVASAILAIKDEPQAKSNSDVYDSLVDQGRGFIGLDEKGQKALKKLVLDEFRRTIKKIFK